jgi:hypothetical protein
MGIYPVLMERKNLIIVPPSWDHAAGSEGKLRRQIENVF